MNCPRCETSILDEKDRDGVTIDQCPECRGVWLDRGELEKLVQRALREIESAEEFREERRELRTEDSRRHEAPHRERDDDERRHDKSRHGQHPRKKRSWFESLDDLFGG